jgi:hypothetical protein
MGDFGSTGAPAHGVGVPDPLAERYYPLRRNPGIISMNER